MTEEQIQLTNDELELARQAVHDLFQKLEIDGTFEIAEHDNTIEVALETQDTGIVIGYHGEILEALQLILSLLIAKKIGRFVRTLVEVGDYRKNRSEYLEKLAYQAKERALADGAEQTLHSLKAWERRVIHMLLQDDKEVASESVGEGKDRVLVVKPRS